MQKHLMTDIKTAGAKGGLVPSFAHGMAQGNTNESCSTRYNHRTL